MPDLSRGMSELDTRLAQIDRKLRAVQVALDPGREPAPSPEPAETHEAGLIPTAIHAKLVSAMGELLDAYGWTLQQPPAAELSHHARELQSGALSAGPFADIAAVRAFEHALLRIPGVREVVLRGYETENHAIFDVRLSAPNA
jgi:hypothetical protein